MRRRKKWAFPEPPQVAGARWIALGNNKWVLIDEEDFARVIAIAWHFNKKTGYAASMNVGDGRRDLLHRVIMNASKGWQVDHRDGNKLDCRKSNLQLFKTGDPTNARNRMKGVGCPRGQCKSKFKGVSRLPRTTIVRWEARIHLPKLIILGQFEDEADAAKAYDDAARKYFRGDARVNFPRPGEKSCRID